MLDSWTRSMRIVRSTVVAMLITCLPALHVGLVRACPFGCPTPEGIFAEPFCTYVNCPTCPDELREICSPIHSVPMLDDSTIILLILLLTLTGMTVLLRRVALHKMP